MYFVGSLLFLFFFFAVACGVEIIVRGDPLTRYRREMRLAGCVRTEVCPAPNGWSGAVWWDARRSFVVIAERRVSRLPGAPYVWTLYAPGAKPGKRRAVAVYPTERAACEAALVERARPATG